MRKIAVVLVTLVLLVAGMPPGARAAGPAHTVTYDRYSFLIDGRRTQRTFISRAGPELRNRLLGRCAQPARTVIDLFVRGVVAHRA